MKEGLTCIHLRRKSKSERMSSASSSSRSKSKKPAKKRSSGSGSDPADTLLASMGKSKRTRKQTVDMAVGILRQGDVLQSATDTHIGMLRLAAKMILESETDENAYTEVHEAMSKFLDALERTRLPIAFRDLLSGHLRLIRWDEGGDDILKELVQYRLEHAKSSEDLQNVADDLLMLAAEARVKARGEVSSPESDSSDERVLKRKRKRVRIDEEDIDSVFRPAQSRRMEPTFDPYADEFLPETTNTVAQLRPIPSVPDASMYDRAPPPQQEQEHQHQYGKVMYEGNVHEDEQQQGTPNVVNEADFARRMAASQSADLFNEGHPFSRENLHLGGIQSTRSEPV